MAEKEKQLEKMTAEREKKNSQHPWLYLFSVILLIVIAVTFVGAPVVGDAVRGTTSSISFGKYGKEDIEFSQNGYFAQQREILGQQINPNGDSQSWKWDLYRVWRGAFERTVVHVGILSEVKSNKTYISQEQLNKLIIEHGPYQSNGEFDVELYQNTPSYKREEFRKDFKENLLKEYYLSDYLYGQKTADAEKEYTYGLMKNQRSFHLVFFPMDRIPDEELTAYAQQNLKNFKRIGLSKITLSSESDAKKVLKMVQDDPESFAETAKAQSTDVFAEGGGAMGTSYSYELKSEFSDADLDKILALAQGAVSDIIKSGNDYVIYRCTAAATDPDLTSADTIRAIKNYVNRYERGFVEDKAVTVADTFIKNAQAEGIYSAASKAGVSVYTTEPFCVNYGAINYFSQVRVEQGELDLSGAMYSKDFFIQAFSIKGEEYSKPIILNNGVAVLQLAEESTRDDIDEAVKLYGNQIDGQIAEGDIINYFLTSDKLKDNFHQTFSKYFTFD
ncbi:MAG: peptidyl-prolyl cis-trans isomerase [Spirochaetia bacterium]|nr:peptidyl-prolyl cis-trans isomerase [Spirochaetia bacterium]MBQ3713126.1 peptidyl-prolyl cis-trans isomerase [Spirochaetia bacterium]